MSSRRLEPRQIRRERVARFRGQALDPTRNGGVLQNIGLRIIEGSLANVLALADFGPDLVGDVLDVGLDGVDD
ncbi:hypothetical protein KEM55_009255 [Ascosphaera atra]|nr:hypothetical protein KEM55_009255 [Ascosphaera atra]